jgi:hypothetical protein
MATAPTAWAAGGGWGRRGDLVEGGGCSRAARGLSRTPRERQLNPRSGRRAAPPGPPRGAPRPQAAAPGPRAARAAAAPPPRLHRLLVHARDARRGGGLALPRQHAQQRLHGWVGVLQQRRLAVVLLGQPRAQRLVGEGAGAAAARAKSARARARDGGECACVGSNGRAYKRVNACVPARAGRGAAGGARACTTPHSSPCSSACFSRCSLDAAGMENV